MITTIKHLFTAKREYKEQMARAELLPDDYRFVFGKIHAYIWRLAGGDGYDMLQTQGNLIDFFESSASEGKPVLSIVGKDVALFCDDFIHDTKKWTDTYRTRLNRKTQKG